MNDALPRAILSILLFSSFAAVAQEGGAEEATATEQGDNDEPRRPPLPLGSIVTAVGAVMPEHAERYAIVVSAILDDSQHLELGAGEFLRIERFAFDIARASKVVGGFVTAVEAADGDQVRVTVATADAFSNRADVVESILLPIVGDGWVSTLVGRTIIAPCDGAGSLLGNAKVASLVDGGFFVARGVVVEETTMERIFGGLQ